MLRLVSFCYIFSKIMSCYTKNSLNLGDLTSNVTDSGVGEVYSKRVAKQLASAIDYMHSK